MDVIDYTKMMNSYKQEQPARFQLGTRALSRQAGGGATQPGSMGGGKVLTSEGGVLVHDLQTITPTVSGSLCQHLTRN